MRLLLGPVVLALVLSATAACAVHDRCDTAAVAAARELGSPAGVRLHFHGSPAQGCVGVVATPHPRQVLQAYARAMHDHGWRVGRIGHRLMGVNDGLELRGDAVDGGSVVLHLGHLGH